MTIASTAADDAATSEDTTSSGGTIHPVTSTAAVTTGSLKSGVELSDYIKCYLEPSAHSRYNAVQSTMRETAAAFNMPESLVECSFFQESRFNATATNTVTIWDKKKKKFRKINRPQICRGIAQINDNTVKEIEKIISKKLTDIQRTDFEAMLKSPEKYKEGQITTAEVALVQDDLARLWRNYFLSKGQVPPKSFNREMVLNPEYAIPAGALYHLYNLRRIASSTVDSRSGGDVSIEELEKDIDFLPTGAAAYNMGLGRTQGIIKRYIKSLPEGTKITVQVLNDALNGKSVPLETKNYMKSVRTCMETGNFHSFVQGKSAKDKDCEPTAMILKFIGISLAFIVCGAWAGESLPTTFVFQCPNTSKAFVENLGKLQEQVTDWTKAQTKLSDTPDLVLVFAPHLLPKKFPMILGNKACWVGLNDFRGEPSKKSYEYWMACLGNMNLQDVPQVKAINDCWLKITSKNKK